MNSNILGLALSFPLLALVIVVGILLKRYASISSEAMRKFVHIGVSNWWFIEVHFFTTLSYALIGPILFIILNGLFTFLNWGKSLGMDDKKRNYGLIYFPVTLLVLVLLQYQGIVSDLACSIAVFVMGYGDGLAALVGSKWGKKKLPVPGVIKSWAGTLTMALVSTLVVLIGLAFFSGLSFSTVLAISLVIGVAAAVMEALTPLGLDNITVPMVVVLLLGVFL
ncbi:MAG: diacylglycerol/polyprenol kinase family protein [Sphaerochaetaceae bacterium]